MTFYRFAVLGSPVKHSRSPELHAAMLESAGLDGEYLAIEADDRTLAGAVVGLREGRWHGLNITMPLKREAAKLADSLAERAARAGSVNTLSLRDGMVHGDTTDSVAFSEILDTSRFREGTTALILGAGGAAAAALTAIPPRMNVYLAARRTDRAAVLVRRMGGEAVSWGTPVAGAIVINTTPLGMHGESLPEGVLKTGSGLIDLPYGRAKTPAVVAAEQTGIPYADGHEFLLRQAIASFASWTGESIELSELQQALRKL
ncbi:MAG: shikimate dehydrogenase family protein [Actinomycetota bacterium]